LLPFPSVEIAPAKMTIVRITVILKVIHLQGEIRVDKIIQIKGKVKHPITLDPSVWIFDDRKVDLKTYFHTKSDQPSDSDDLTEYKKSISKQWDREIAEGATLPPTLSSERKFLKEKLLTGTFAMPFQPFLTNAEPDESARALVIIMNEEEVELPLEEAYNLLFCFSIDGKPIKDDGPVYIYYGDGSNLNEPFKNVTELRVI
jgi:hypothetical protein